MNKTELIGCVAEKSGLAKKDAEKAVNAVLDAVVETLKAGEKVQPGKGLNIPSVIPCLKTAKKLSKEIR